MNTTQAIRARRSIRQYKPGTIIPQEHIDLLLEAAMCAPSAHDERPWHFIVIESAAVRRQIVEAIEGNEFLIDVPLAIVICGEPDAPQGRSHEGYWPQGCAAATQNLLLQATELGYGSCWCGLHPGERTPIITKILDIKDVIPLSLIAVGVPDETPDAKNNYDKQRVRYVR